MDELELPERLLLCLGAEAAGLRAKTRKALDAALQSRWYRASSR